MHFTRNHKFEDHTPLQIKGNQVQPADSIKLLGVVFDKALRFKLHVARTAKRGIQAALALKRLKGLRASTCRQLFQSTVAPVMDYASIIWAPKGTKSSLKCLKLPQRIAAQAITGAFSSVSLEVAEFEADIQPISARHYEQQRRFWVNAHTAEKSHPIYKSVTRAKRGTKRFTSPLQTVAVTFSNLDLSRLETITPYCIPPWQPRPQVVIPPSREEAAERAKSHDTVALYTDGSARNGLVGIGVTWSPQYAEATTIGDEDNLNAYFAELFAIDLAIHKLIPVVDSTAPTLDSITIFSDCQGALKSIARPAHQSGQALIRSILQRLEWVRTHRQYTIILQWTPGHEGVPGNELAHKEAYRATEPGRTPIYQLHRLKSAALRCSNHRYPPCKVEIAKNTGLHSNRVDKALPGKHTRKLYNDLKREDATILSQLRTGKCRLNGYLHRIGAVISNVCSCGREEETVDHFLFKCNRWSRQRQTLRREGPTRWGDISYYLGGWSGREQLDGSKDKWSPNLDTVKATIAFARATKRLDLEALN